MGNLTLSIPDDLRKRMDKYKFMNWSAVAREGIERRIEEMELLDEITSKSTLTEEDAIELGRELNKRMTMRYLEKRGLM